MKQVILSEYFNLDHYSKFNMEILSQEYAFSFSSWLLKNHIEESYFNQAHDVKSSTE